VHVVTETRAPRLRPAALGWFGIWLVVAAVVVLPYVRAYTALSPFDELVHVDYLVKAQHLELVNGGEKVGQTAMREQACRGHDIASIEFPPCKSKRFDTEDFPEEGFNTAYPDPPVYYAVTAAGAAVVELLPGVDSVVAAARSVGVLWLAAGLQLTFLLCRRMGADAISSAGVTLLVATTPSVAHSMATVTSDAPLLLVGAGLCLLSLGVAQGRVSWWWLALAAGLAAGVKATVLPVLGLVLVFLLLHLHVQRQRGTHGPVDERPEDVAPGLTTRAQVLRPVAGVGVAAALVLAGWALLNSLTAWSVVDQIPMRDRFEVSSIGLTELVGNVLPLFSPVQAGYLPPFMVSSTYLPVIMAVFNLILVTGVVGAAWAGGPRTENGRMAAATMAAMLLSGPALVLVIFLGSHTYIPIPFRYGQGLVPAAAACAAWAASQRRAGGPFLVGLGLVSLAVLLAQTW